MNTWGLKCIKERKRMNREIHIRFLYMRRNASKKNFIEALTSERKNKELPEECNFFGKLIGSWKIDYIDNTTSVVRKGEWHFSWVLEGMAIQDVIVLPGFEYGTTLRVFNPDTRGWDVAYCFTGKNHAV